MNKYTSNQVEAAIEEVKFLITLKAKECQARGWSYKLSNDAPETFKALKDSVSEGLCIPISKEGCDSTIYDDPSINHLFRFWHDVTHLELDSGFSLKGELKVIEQHLKEANELKLSPLAIEVLKADTEGQVRYYYHHKQFVENQRAFVDSCLQYGIRKALSVKH